MSKAYIKLGEKSYFSSPGISWKAKNDEVNIIYPSNFWLKKKTVFLITKKFKPRSSQ